MTDTADRIARLRLLFDTPRNETADVLALCDDYETLAADKERLLQSIACYLCDGDTGQLVAVMAEWERPTHECDYAASCTLSDEEAEAVRLFVDQGGLARTWPTPYAVLRRLLGETP